MEAIFYIFIFLTTLFLVKEYKLRNNQKARMKKLFPFVLIGWTILFIIYQFHMYPNAIRLEFLFYILFVLYNIAFLIYIRAFVNNNYWFLLLLIPCTFLFYDNVLIFNKPTYNGAMDGFAAISTFYSMLEILITYPFFVFAFCMTKGNQIIKSTLMFLFVIITGIIGIMQSAGYEGYLADDTGMLFAAMLFMLADMGIYHLIKKNSTPSLPHTT